MAARRLLGVVAAASAVAATSTYVGIVPSTSMVSRFTDAGPLAEVPFAAQGFVRSSRAVYAVSSSFLKEFNFDVGYRV